MAKLLGWKDVLRPIRDGYRHLFPAPDTGPTPEERRKQRELDRLKGFTYFDTFDQLEEWTESDSDPIQRANTSLLRCPVPVDDGQPKADTLLIHDYAGNYHPYEAVQRTKVDGELYTCEYLQHIDILIYFSHKLVCVPPPSWTNVLHRNGVISLGTFLIEPQTENSERIFKRTGDHLKWKFPIAKQLANIARHYGFDGWLANIEKSFPKTEWNPDVLDVFLEDLKAEMGKGKKLIWYDALTFNNKVSYQNTLNRNNAPWAITCGDILLNYCWNEADAKAAVEFAPRINLTSKDVILGIDVWAQNTTKLAHPRVTYPEKGGGGTNTGIAVAKAAALGLSVGIFAPAWTFEHFPGHGRAVERATWEGADLPESLDCSCGNCRTRHQVNAEFPIIKSSRERPAGSEFFFYTDFGRAFTKHSEREERILNAQFGAQSVLPRPWTSTKGDNTIRLSYQFEDTTERTRLVIEQYLGSTEEGFEQQLSLYKLNMSMARPLYLQAQCRNLASAKPDLIISFYIKSTNGIQLLPVSRSSNTQSVKAPIYIEAQDVSNTRLHELGVHVRCASELDIDARRLLEINDICITPEPGPRASKFTIHDLRAEHRGEGENFHVRLCWKYSVGTHSEKVDGLPSSDITGPFSYFKVRIDDVEIGRAYALEHPLLQDLAEGDKERNVEIVGVGFDGRKLAESKVVLIM